MRLATGCLTVCWGQYLSKVLVRPAGKCRLTVPLIWQVPWPGTLPGRELVANRIGRACLAVHWLWGRAAKSDLTAQDLAVLGLIMGFVRLSAGTEGTSGLDVPPEENAQKHEC